jgi:site-specific DNA recombinase
MRAIIYCRVSTDRQVRQGDSLESQRMACLSYCERQGWDVAEIFMEEGESAKTADRTQLKRLLAYCEREKGRVQVLVVYTLSRFARNSLDHMTLRLALTGFGVTLRSATEPIDETDEGEFMEHIISGVAQYENRKRAKCSVAGMQNKLRKGGWTFKPPLGYRRVVNDAGKKAIAPDPATAGFVRRAFELYATGLHTKKEVLRRVTLLGLRTVEGRKLSSQTFGNILGNPLYAGIVRVESWEIAQRGTFEPIIGLDTFRQVEAILEGKKPTVTPRLRLNPDFPLRHFVRCGNCGKPLTASWAKGRTKRYPFYHCQNRHCIAKVSMRKEKLESLFYEFLKRLQPSSEYVLLYKAVVLDVWNIKRAESCELRLAAELKVRELMERKAKLNEAYIYQQAISQRDYQEMKAPLVAELALAEIEEREARGEELDIEAVIDFAENVFMDAARLWFEMSTDQKQRFQQVLFPEGVDFTDGNYRTTATCLMFSGLEPKQPEKEQLVALTGIEPVSRRSNWVQPVPDY